MPETLTTVVANSATTPTTLGELSMAQTKIASAVKCYVADKAKFDEIVKVNRQLSENLQAMTKERDTAKLSAAALDRECARLVLANTGLVAEVKTLTIERDALRARIAELESEPEPVPPPKPIAWPSPKGRVIVNGYPYLASRPAAWFPSGEGEVLVASLSEQFGAGGKEAAQRAVDAAKAAMFGRGWQVGRYISATTIVDEAEQRKYPGECVTTEQWGNNRRIERGTWPGEPWRRFVDIADPETARRMAHLVADAGTGYSVLEIDNCPVTPWAESVEFIRQIAVKLTAMGVRGLFNLPIHVGALSYNQRNALIEALRGHALQVEMPFGAADKLPSDQRPEFADTTIAAYSAFCDADIPIVMTLGRLRAGTRDAESDAAWFSRISALRTWVETWRAAQARVWVGWPFLFEGPVWTKGQ